MGGEEEVNLRLKWNHVFYLALVNWDRTEVKFGDSVVTLALGFPALKTKIASEEAVLITFASSDLNYLFAINVMEKGAPVDSPKVYTYHIGERAVSDTGETVESFLQKCELE